MFEVTEAVVAVSGKGRVGVRVSPLGNYNGMSDSDPFSTFGYAAKELGQLGIAPVLKKAFAGLVIGNGGYLKDTGNAALADGRADLISFGSRRRSTVGLKRGTRTIQP